MVTRNHQETRLKLAVGKDNGFSAHVERETLDLHKIWISDPGLGIQYRQTDQDNKQEHKNRRKDYHTNAMYLHVHWD